MRGMNSGMYSQSFVMIGNNLLKSDNNTEAHLSLFEQCNHVANADTDHVMDTSQVAQPDIEACKLVGGVQRVARAL